MSIGALSHFGFAESSAADPKTLATINKFLDPTSADIEDKFPTKAVPTLREDRSQIRNVKELTEVKGSFSTPMYYNVLPWFLKFGLGKVTSTKEGATNAYTHVFEGTKILPSFSAEVSYDTAGAKQASGCKMDKLTIKAEAGNEAEMSAEFMGIASYMNAAAALVGLPGDDNIAVFSHATVLFDGDPNEDVNSCEITIENSLEAVKTLNGTPFIQRIVEGVRKVGCNLEMDFRNQDVYELSRNSTKVGVTLEFESPIEAATGHPFKITIEMPNVRFSGVGNPVSADGVVSQSVECVPLFDPQAGYDIRITVTNTDTAYPNAA